MESGDKSPHSKAAEFEKRYGWKNDPAKAEGGAALWSAVTCHRFPSEAANLTIPPRNPPGPPPSSPDPPAPFPLPPLPNTVQWSNRASTFNRLAAGCLCTLCRVVGVVLSHVDK